MRTLRSQFRRRAASRALIAVLAAACLAAVALAAAPTRSTARHPAAHRVELERPKSIPSGPAVQLVESVPVETQLGNPELPRAHDVWIEMIHGARRSLDLEQFYLSTWPGEPMDDVVDEIGRAAARGVRVRLLLDKRMHETYPLPADSLGALAGIEVRTIDMGKVSGSGVQHAKYFLVDGSETYLGSQNFDWRSLKHIHELGARVRDPQVTAEFGRVFEMDWAKSAPIPRDSVASAARGSGPAGAPSVGPVGAAKLPLRLVQAPGDTLDLWTSYSPERFIPDSSRWDRDAIVRVLEMARKEIVIQLLTYGTGEGDKHDDALDQALHRAARRGVRVRLMVSDWMANRPAMKELEALAAEPNTEVRLSVVPEWSGGYIPFARVEHCKYMVVDTLWTWVGTANWEPGYFHGSRNAALSMLGRPLARQARAIFDASWGSPTARVVRADETYKPKDHRETPPPGKTTYGK